MTPRLRLDIEKRYDSFELHMELEVGTEIMVLFGPSGAGKTTTLQAVSGLLSPDAGEIEFDGDVFFRRSRPGDRVDLPARRRGVGYVFQGYALFPHLTALENVAFPLRGHTSRGKPEAEELLESMRIQHLAHRYPREMSGGQQQRVALARALAARPGILLLDEPFSAVDRPMRERLQRDLRRLQAELGLVVLCVTHNLEDAFGVGHRLAVVQDGRVQQVGRVGEVLRRPRDLRSAEVVGVSNVFHALVVEASADGLVLDWDGLRLEAPPQHTEVGERVPVYIRPEDVKVLYPDRRIGESLRANRVEAVVVDLHHSGTVQSLRVELPNGHEVDVRFPGYTYLPLNLSVGGTVELCLRREAVGLLHGPEGVEARSS
ncbi:MAG: ABC transporter ATP-binding protein [Actinobacteria bacterium]|nr:ABC transporter ATP-binding protein [Actinomycetota bacterium]